jgi:hypothetical protein
MRQMQYLISVIDDSAELATPKEDSAGSSAAVAPPGSLDLFNDRLEADGHWVFAGGLAAPATATVIDNRGEKALVTDGPFLESKEHLGGFWVIEAADLDEALRLAADGSKACNRKVELRAFLAVPEEHNPRPAAAG